MTKNSALYHFKFYALDNRGFSPDPAVQEYLAKVKAEKEKAEAKQQPGALGAGFRKIFQGAAIGASGIGTSASWVSQKVKETHRSSDPGLFLAFFGFGIFVLNEYINNFWLASIIATFLMFYSTLTIFEGEGIITATLFWITYIYLIGTLGLGFTEIVKFYAAPLALIGMITHGFIKKFRRSGTFLDGFIGEIKGAAIPILLFMFDLGLIELLTGLFRIPQAFLNPTLLTYVPWWGMLGLGTTEKKTTFVTILRVFMWFYIIVLIMTGVEGLASGFYQESFIAEPQELFEEKLRAREEIKPENPLESYGACLIAGRLAELNVCVPEEQRKSLAESTCKNLGLSSGPDFDQCVKEEISRLEKAGAKGATDLTQKEYLEAEFKPLDEHFPKTVFDEPRKNFPLTLEIKNPLQQEIGLEVTCKFTRGGSEVPGEITIKGQPTAQYSTNLKQDPVRIGCKPTQDLEGKYNLGVEATLTNIITTTTLTRAFVKTEPEKKRWEAEIRSSTSSGFSSGLSQAPAEFARLNFGLGNFPDEPIIIVDQPVVFTASIEDVGKGRISRIRGYLFSSLLEKGFFVISGDQVCLESGEIFFPKKIKQYNLAECFLELPAEYQQFDLKYLVDTFEAKLTYDYTLTQTVQGISVENTDSRPVPRTSPPLVS